MAPRPGGHPRQRKPVKDREASPASVVLLGIPSASALLALAEAAGLSCDDTRIGTRAIPDHNILIPDLGAQIAYNRLTLQGKVEAKGEYYLNYVEHNLAAGERLDLHVGLPGAGPRSLMPRKSNTPGLAWIVFRGTLTVAILGYPFLRHSMCARGCRERITVRSSSGSLP